MIKLPALVLCLALLLCSCGTGGSASQPPSMPPAATLVVYTSHTREVYGPIIKEFQDRTGIWVQVEVGGTNEMMRRLTAESGAPVCDVMFGGSVESHEANQNLFQPYKAADTTQLLPAFVSPQNNWTPFSCLPLVILYNTQLVPQNQIPQGWQALFGAEWQGKIAFANPSISASCYTALATLIQLGNTEDWTALNKLAANIEGSQLQSSGDIPTAVASGQFPLGITLEEAALRQVQAGEPVAIVYPAEGTSAVPDATSLIKGAPHIAEAQQFIDFTISRDVQQLLSTNLYRRAVRADVGIAFNAPALHDIPLVPYDITWSSTCKEEIVSYWNELM